MKKLLNLKCLRKEKGVSQQYMADLLDISRVHYTNLENGKRETNFENLTKLADFFGVTTDYLLGESDIPHLEETLVIPDILKNVKIAAHGGEDDWTQEEVDNIAKFVEFVRSQRN